MGRVQQRCLLASVAFHAALLALLVFAPAFTPESPALPVLTLIPTDLKLTDGDKIGGGNPDARPPSAGPKAAAQAEPPSPPEPKQEPKPEPAKPLPKAEPKPPEPKAEPKAEPKTRKPVQVADEPVHPKPPVTSQDTDPALRSKPLKKPLKLANDIKLADTAKKRDKREKEALEAERKAAKAAADAEAAETAEREAAAERRRVRAAQVAALNADRQRMADSISGAAATVGKNLAGSAKVEMPGPGGQAYAPYGSYLGAFYKERWRKPSSISARSAYVGVEIDVARDGRVVDMRMEEKSGHRALDDSVRDVIQRYKQLRPLPDGTTDAKRTFRIKFTLEADSNT
jgi:TonB family protein